MAEKKSQALQARVEPNHPDTKLFRAYATAYELDDSELLRRIISEWAATVDKDKLKEKLQKTLDKQHAEQMRALS